MRTIKPKSYKERDEVFLEKKKSLPSVSLSSADFPEVDKWKQGDKYRVEMVVTMTRKDEYGGGFEIEQFAGSPERVKRKRS